MLRVTWMFAWQVTNDRPCRRARSRNASEVLSINVYLCFSSIYDIQRKASIERFTTEDVKGGERELFTFYYVCEWLNQDFFDHRWKNCSSWMTPSVRLLDVFASQCLYPIRCDLNLHRAGGFRLFLDDRLVDFLSVTEYEISNCYPCWRTTNLERVKTKTSLRTRYSDTLRNGQHLRMTSSNVIVFRRFSSCASCARL